jgi:hypothetical protein
MKKLLKRFSKACEVATKEQRKRLIRSLVKEIKLGYDENGKVIPVSMTLNFTGEQIKFMGDNSELFGLKKKNIESIVLLSHKSPDSVINVTVEFGEGEGKVSLDAIAERAKKYQPKPKITYKMIQEYVEKKYGFKVHTAYITGCS